MPFTKMEGIISYIQKLPDYGSTNWLQTVVLQLIIFKLQTLLMIDFYPNINFLSSSIIRRMHGKKKR